MRERQPRTSSRSRNERVASAGRLEVATRPLVAGGKLVRDLAEEFEQPRMLLGMPALQEQRDPLLAGGEDSRVGRPAGFGQHISLIWAGGPLAMADLDQFGHPAVHLRHADR